jgi:ACT domain-containing protein
MSKQKMAMAVEMHARTGVLRHVLQLVDASTPSLTIYLTITVQILPCHRQSR